MALQPKQTLARSNLVRLACAFLFLIYCTHREIYIANNLVPTNLAKKYRHIRPVSKNNGEEPKITFQLHPPSKWPITLAFNPYVTCPLGNITEGKGNKRRNTTFVRDSVLLHELVRSGNGRVLDFNTQISTSLKILSIGDSVTVQFSQSLDEMLGGLELNSRTKLWEAWNGHDGGSVVFPTYGGGAAATWRMTGLLSKMNEGKPPDNSGGGGWNITFVERLRESVGTDSTIGNFDVVVLRVMHGWMALSEITPNRLFEAIHLSMGLLGATTVILQTIPFTNNVKTLDDLKSVNFINGIIKTIAHRWDTQSKAKHVLVQDLAQYYNQLIWTNAQSLGYPVSNARNVKIPAIIENEGPNFLFDRLKSGEDHPPSIPMVCADMESLGSDRSRCNRNNLFSDGMHVCPEMLASRYAASLACLMGCVYNQGGGERGRGREYIRSCEKECNDLFMSVMPVDDVWVNGSVTLAAFG